MIASHDRQLDSRPILSFVNAIRIHQAGREARELLDRADGVNPHNYVARAAYMSAIETRWGGSQELMQAFLEECRSAQLSDSIRRAVTT